MPRVPHRQNRLQPWSSEGHEALMREGEGEGGRRVIERLLCLDAAPTA